MDEKFAGVKGVGFDLDQTLYPNSAETQNAVRNEVYRTIANHLDIPLAQAKEKFEDAYARIGAGGRAIESLGIPKGREVMRDCLSSADVSSMLKRDGRLVGMMGRMSKQYKLFLVTDSRIENAHSKLNALGINPEVFSVQVFWDLYPARPGMVQKDDGTAYEYAQHSLGLHSQELVYIGNNEKEDIVPAADLGWRTIHLSEKPSSRATAGIQEIYDLERLLL